MKPPPPPAEQVLWTANRPPSVKMRIWTWTLATVACIAGAWLLRSLQLDPMPWWQAVVIAGALGALIPLSVGSGGSVWIDREQQLWYGYGRSPQIRFSLAEVTELRWVETGILRGVGMCVNPETVTFLHRKGMSYSTMRRWRKHLKVDLVLEHMTPNDLSEIQSRRDQIN